MSLILIDTSVWARVKESAVASSVARAIDTNAVVITDAIVLELLRSARSASELEQLAAEYDALHHLALTPEMLRRARDVQAQLAKRGYHRGPSPIDLLGAAAAEAVDAELWHRDKHFDLIAAVTGQRTRRL